MVIFKWPHDRSIDKIKRLDFFYKYICYDVWKIKKVLEKMPKFYNKFEESINYFILS